MIVDKDMGYKTFTNALIILIPDIATNERVLNPAGSINIKKLVKFINYKIIGSTTFFDIYNYIEKNKHMYEWWNL